MNNRANCAGKVTAPNVCRGREKTVLAPRGSCIAVATMSNATNPHGVPRGYRRGIAVIWAALILILMIGLVGLAIDCGWAALDLHNLQNAGDAGALAGAMVIKQAHKAGDLAPTYTAAQLLTLANRAANEAVDVYFDAATNDPTLDVVVGRWWMSTRTFEALAPGSTDVPNAVKVVPRHVDGWHVNQPLPLFFGPLFGADTADLKREAIAICTGGGGAALVCLDPVNPGIVIEGGAMLYVNAGPVPGEIYVDSALLGGNQNKDWAVYPTEASAPDWEKGWVIDCAAMNVVGRVEPVVMDYFSTPPDYDYYPIIERAAPIPDPLRWLPALGLPEPGTAIEVDPVTGDPLLDANGDYIPRLFDDPLDFPDEGPQPLDVTQPIGHEEIANYGELIGGTRRTLTLVPGYYSGGVHVVSSGGENNTVRMLPGVYALGGGPQSVGAAGKAKSGLQFYGGALDAEGVMVYITQSIEGNYGSVDLASYEYINMTEYQYIPGDPAYYMNYSSPPDGAGMCMFQDRSNPMNANIQAGGGGLNMTMGGTLYFHCTGVPTGIPYPPVPPPAGTWGVTVEVGGSSGDTGIQLITDRVLIHGDANITIKYDGRNYEPADQALLVK